MKLYRAVPPFNPASSGRYVPDRELLGRIQRAWDGVGKTVTLWVEAHQPQHHGHSMLLIRSDLIDGVPRDA